MRTGVESKRHPGRGVYVQSLGPHSAVPGDWLRIVLYDADDRVVRRFEQIEGAIVDPGYVDFFLGPHCRPMVRLRPIVDIDADGAATELIADFTPHMDQHIYLGLLAAWVERHAVLLGARVAQEKERRVSAT